MLCPDEGPSVRVEILQDCAAFWGERDVRALHHPLWLRQFSADGVIAREDGVLQGYLFGVVGTHGLAYAHLIATRSPEQRGRGLGRRLYETFLDNARNQGADRVEAITSTANTGSIAFHRRLGFSTEMIEDYSGPGQDRVLFRRTITPC
jgi:L-amino acid N-acyltransferase YncA